MITEADLQERIAQVESEREQMLMMLGGANAVLAELRRLLAVLSSSTQSQSHTDNSGD